MKTGRSSKIFKVFCSFSIGFSDFSADSADFALLRSVSQAAEAKLKADLDGLGALREPGKAAPNVVNVFKTHVLNLSIQHVEVD